MITAALILLFTGPWLVYPMIPVPDQLAEYRNYSMVAGFALFCSFVPEVLWIPLMAYFIAMSHHHAMAYTDQIAFWKRAQKATSGDPSRATGEIGAFLKINGKNEESEPYLKEAIRLNPGFAPALENLASIYLLTGREAEAYRTAEVLIKRCPKYASGWQMMGHLYEKQERLADAERCFLQAVWLAEEFSQSWNHLGLMAFKSQRFEQALDWFRKAGKPHPAEPTFQYNEAIALYALGRKEEGDAIRARFNGIPIQWNPEMIPPPQQPQPELQPV